MERCLVGNDSKMLRVLLFAVLALLSIVLLGGNFNSRQADSVQTTAEILASESQRSQDEDCRRIVREHPEILLRASARPLAMAAAKH